MRTSRGKASGLSGVDEKNRRMRNVVGPTTSSVLTICSRNPATIDAIAMTVAIPITTPRMVRDRKSTRLNSSHMSISYAVFSLKKKKMTRKVSAEVDLVHQQTQNQRYGSSHIGAPAKSI